VTGKPDEIDLKEIHSPVANTMFENLKLDRGERRPFDLLIPRASPEALDLIEKLLVLRPSTRITADEALEHEFVSHFYDLQKDDLEEQRQQGEMVKDPDEYPDELDFPLDEDTTHEIAEY